MLNDDNFLALLARQMHQSRLISHTFENSSFVTIFHKTFAYLCINVSTPTNLRLNSPPSSST